MRSSTKESDKKKKNKWKEMEMNKPMEIKKEIGTVWIIRNTKNNENIR